MADVPDDVVVVGAAGGLAGRTAQALAHRAAATATMSNMAIPAWAMRSPARLASSLRRPTARSSSMLGDGSYLMMNSELATSVMLGAQADRRACSTIAASAASTGCSSRPARRAFNNLLADARRRAGDRLRRPCASRSARWPKKPATSPSSKRRWNARCSGRPHAMSSSSTPTPTQHGGRRRLVGRGGARSVRTRRGPSRAQGL